MPTDQIYRLAKYMALAKGAINRLEPEEQLTSIVESFRAAHRSGQVWLMELWLAQRTDAEMEIITDGEGLEQESLLADSPVPNYLLDDLYEAI